MHSTVKEVKNDGLNVLLADGSEWCITPKASLKTVSWEPNQRVAVEKSGDEFFPYFLTNLDAASQERIKASRIN